MSGRAHFVAAAIDDSLPPAPSSMQSPHLIALTWFALSTLAGAAAQEEAKLVSADAAGGDTLGHCVGASGDTILVGATGDDDLGTFTGSAYVFTGGPGGWSQEAKLLASDAGIAQRFGWSGDVDGDTAVVGAIFGNGLAPVSGSAYVFVRSGGAWSQQEKLEASDGASSDWYSRSVAISGETIAVGAAQDDDNGADSGSVYVYERSGTVWSETAKLTPGDGAANDTFGEALSLSGDLLVVGSPQDDDGGASSSGSAYVFKRTLGAWSQVAKLTANDPTFGAWLGKALHTDGERVIVGGYRGDDGGTGDCGVAYVFSDTGGGWSQEAKLVASDKTGGDQFGWSVNIQGDEALVGAVQRASGTGAVYRFLRGTSGWVEDAIVLASDASTGDSYGWSLARDGEVVAVGASGAPSPAGNSGAAYVLRYETPFTSYCFGDGSGTLCPCANTGAAGAGCANSATSGGLLVAEGTASALADDLAFSASDLPAGKPSLLFFGTQQAGAGAGVLLGDGLLCAGGAIQRLDVRTSSPAGTVAWGPGLVATYGFAADDRRDFQVWYRDPAGPCNLGNNLTNGVEVIFGP